MAWAITTTNRTQIATVITNTIATITTTTIAPIIITTTTISNSALATGNTIDNLLANTFCELSLQLARYTTRYTT